MSENARREGERLRLAVAKDTAKWASETARAFSHRKLYHHSHHIAYLAYYVFALVEHKGIEAIIAGALLTFSAITAIAGE